MEILYLATSVLSLFFILILTGKKNKSNSDIILILWFVLLFSNVLSFYLVVKTLAPSWLVEFLDHSVFLHGPLLFLYTSALTGIPKKASMKSALHFLPFLLFLLLSAWLAFIEWDYLDNYIAGLIIFKFTVPFVYILISIRIIIQHRRRISNIFSSTNQMELRWLSLVLYGLTGLVFFGASTMIIHFFTRVSIPQSGGQYLNIAYSAFIIVLGYFGFRQTTIFIPAHLQGDQFLFEQSSKKGPATKCQSEQGCAFVFPVLHFFYHQFHPVLIHKFEEIILTPGVDHLGKFVLRNIQLSG